jgi:hypothetical protein
MLAATCVIAVAVLAAVLAVTRRLGGTVLRVGMVAVAFVLVQGYGLGVLTQPWNPYFPLLFWFLTFVAAWAVLAGDDGVLWLAVAAGCVCAQTHISYLILAVVTVGLAIGMVVVRAVRDPAGRRHRVRLLAVAVGLGAAVWLPPLVDQLRRTPGNITMLRDHFEHPTGCCATSTSSTSCSAASTVRAASPSPPSRRAVRGRGPPSSRCGP